LGICKVKYKGNTRGFEGFTRQNTKEMLRDFEELARKIHRKY